MRQTLGEVIRAQRQLDAFYRSAKICGVPTEEAKRVLDEELAKAGASRTVTTPQAIEIAASRIRSMEK